MERADELLGALSAGAGDPAAAASKRLPDSPDDFEHLLAAGESPQRAASALLEAERRGGPPPGFDIDDHESLMDAPPPLGPAMQPAAAPPPRPTHTPEPELLFEPPKPAPKLPEPAPKLPEPAPKVPEQAPKLPEPAPKLPEPAPKLPEPAHEPLPRLEPKAEPATPPAAPQRASAPPQPAPQPPRAPAALAAHVIEAEVIFCKMGLDAWFDPQRLHPEVESLLYWRNPVHSGIALGSGLALLVALAVCSAVSVLAHSALLLLAAAVAYRVYRSVQQAVQKTNDGHPFKSLLETDISVPAERAQEMAAAATAHLNAATNELRRLFLVEDLVDSLKFGVLLWCLTYVGACFNGITLLILGWISLFTLPKAYEMNKSQVDANLELARGKINEIMAKVRAAVPLGKKAESEKDK